MPIAETILATIAQKVFNYALDQGQSKVVDWARDKLGLESKQQAFNHALSKAYKKFEKQYPQWAADLFNASFLEHEGAPILAEFLVRDGHPDPSDLAICWADSLNLGKPERRTTLVRELEPAATDFLDYMARALKAEAELRDLNDSRTFEQLASDLKAIRRKLEAEQATAGTRRDYLHWLIERNLYLDPRGTFQTQRQVQVKLDEVYISLRAQRDKTPGEVDRRLLAQEMSELEDKIFNANLPFEEWEDESEYFLDRVQRYLAVSEDQSSDALELDEIVNRQERLMILGDPGSGKSTLLRYLALKHSQALWNDRTEAGTDLGIARFPILIRIADYAEHGMPKGKSLSDFLADYHVLHECPKFGLTDLLANELASGNCLVLLDGLDEIVNADDRRKVVEHIEDFIRYHGNRPNRFVITSRIAGYRSAQLGGPFAHYTVQEMNETQIRRFLERWCTAVEAAQTPDLSSEARQAVAQREIDAIMKAVQTITGVRRLAANPLLLRTLALIHRTGAQLPQRRIELYKLAADTLARTWRTAQGVPESELVEDRYLTRLLGRLAYWLHANKPTGIATEQEVYRELGQEWARIKGLSWEEDHPDIESQIKKFLRAVREHTGIFVERAPRRYGFMHLTFEEYYAARYLVARSKERAKLIRQHLHKPRWEEPILLALGFVGLDSPDDAAELLETAIMAEGEEAKELGFRPSQYENLLGRDFLFALRCLGDNIPARPRFVEGSIERLADELLFGHGRAKFERYRNTLGEQLRVLEGSDVASILLPYFVDALDTPGIRYWLLYRLAEFGQGSHEVMTILLKTLHDNDSNMRYTAAKSLGRLGQSTPKVVAALLETLNSDNDWSVRRAAVESLGELGVTSPEVIQALLNALNSDIQFAVLARSAVVKTLGILGNGSSEVITALLDMLPRQFVLATSTDVLKSLGQVSRAFPAGVTMIVNALQEAAPSVRVAMAEALEANGHTDSDAIATLRSSMQKDDRALKGKVTRGVAQSELHPLPLRDVEILLLHILHSENAWERWEAVKRLGQLEEISDSAFEALVNVLRNDPAPSVRSIAINSLRQFDASPEVIAALSYTSFTDTDISIRISAVKSLGQLDHVPSLAKEALLKALYDTESSVRAIALENLCALNYTSDEMITRLITMLRTEVEPSMRWYVVKNVGQLEQITGEMEEALVEALSDTNDQVRSEAALLLGKRGQAHENIISALCRKLLDENKQVRTACAQALAQLGQRFPDARETIERKLVQAIEDPEFDKPDSVTGRSAHDYAYDGLWLLVVGGEIDGG